MELAFPGSPTIRVDGRDVDPVGATLASRADLPDLQTPGRARVARSRAASNWRRHCDEHDSRRARHPRSAFRAPTAREHTLESYGDVDVLVLVQSCNHCPYVQAWEGRMKAIQRDYADRGVRLVAVNSNDSQRYPEDSFEEMRRRAERQGFNFDYLWDEDQSSPAPSAPSARPRCSSSTATAGSSTTARSTTAATSTAVAQHYLRDALDAVLEGRDPPVADTPPSGCSVKWRQ